MNKKKHTINDMIKRKGFGTNSRPIEIPARTPEPHSGRYWKCKCDCGNYVLALQEDLTGGLLKSCERCCILP